MLKFEMTAKIGDVIKAYDFEPMPEKFKDRYPDRYIIGRVIDKGMLNDAYAAYTVEVIETSKGDSRVGKTVYVPFETSMDFENRVVLVD